MSKAAELASGQQLSQTDPDAPGAINQGLVSPNNVYQLQYQNDGNLVLYKFSKPNLSPERDETQSSGTHSVQSDYFNSMAEMMPDGKFAIRHESDKGEFTTQAYYQGPAGCNLYLTNDGELFLAKSEDGPRTVVTLEDYKTD